MMDLQHHVYESLGHSWKLRGWMLLTLAHLASAQLSQQQGMCRRFGHQSAMIGNMLYLNGGWRWRQDIDGDNKQILDPSNEFISLDLGPSAQFNIAKNVTLQTPPPWEAINYTVNGAAALPHVANGAMFVDGEDVFIYEGRVPHSGDSVGSSLWLWNHTTSVWGEAQTWIHSDSRVPERYSRGGGLTIPGRGYGVNVGGARIFINDSATPANGEAFYPADEQMVTFDLTPGSGENGKRNRTATTLPGEEKRIGPSLAYIPIGQSGAVVLLGGTEELTDVRETSVEADITVSNFDTGNLAFASMRNINILDLETGAWFSQTATGEYVPDVRMHSCVAVQSAADNSSHNIYMFGGGSGSDMFILEDQIVYNDLWILSLPSFRWVRKVFMSTDGAPAARQQHECHVVGRNMVVIGGTHNATATCSWDEINVLDMTTLQWLTQYSYNSDSYTIPDPVSAAIISNGTTLMDPNNGWDDPRLEALFKGTTATNTHASKSAHAINYGLIIGCIVGGVLVAALAAIGVCLFRRRRRNRHVRELKPPPEFTAGGSGFSTPSTVVGQVYYGNAQFSHEVDGRSSLLGSTTAPYYEQNQSTPVSAATPGRGMSYNAYDGASGDISRVPLMHGGNYAELPTIEDRGRSLQKGENHGTSHSQTFELDM